MIRFIDLGDQILEGHREFAFFDTIVDLFERFNGEETWYTWEDFVYSYNSEPETKISAFQETRPLERYKALFPKDWPNLEHEEEVSDLEKEIESLEKDKAKDTSKGFGME